MTSTLTHQPPRARRAPRRESSPATRGDRARSRLEGARRRTRMGRQALACYLDSTGRSREVVARAGSKGSVLVIDRDAVSLGDRRLVAHLCADEPQENAAIVCGCYLQDLQRSHSRCRPLTPEDACTVPFPEDDDWGPPTDAQCGDGLLDSSGSLHRLEQAESGMSIPELRWLRHVSQDDGGEPAVISVREVVAALESYEPVRTLTHRALSMHRDDPSVSTTVLRAEFARVLESPIVLNRALREAVLAAIEREQLSMSEIAIRCGRVKRDCRGNESGETSWLARRLGMLPEGGHTAPTPWIHIDVLALIARSGLGISPREVEL
jgi:hypothetical protein